MSMRRKTPMPRATRLVGATLLAMVVVLTARSQASIQDVDFTGTWNRNPEMSQFWREPYESAPRTDSAQWNDEETMRLVARVEQMLQLAERVEIDQTADDLNFRIGTTEVRIFYFAREHVRQTPWGSSIQASTRWEGDDLIIREEAADGSIISERLTLLEGGDQMAHLLVWENGKLFQRPVTIRSVYDRAEE